MHRFSNIKVILSLNYIIKMYFSHKKNRYHFVDSLKHYIHFFIWNNHIEHNCLNFENSLKLFFFTMKLTCLVCQCHVVTKKKNNWRDVFLRSIFGKQRCFRDPNILWIFMSFQSLLFAKFVSYFKSNLVNYNNLFPSVNQMWQIPIS